MYRIDNQLGATVLPAPSAPSITPDLFFTAGDEIAGVQATIVDAEWLNMVQEEICYVITANGMTLNKGDRTQLRQAIAYMTGQDLGGYLPLGGGTLTGNLALPNLYFTGEVSGPLLYSSGNISAAGTVSAPNILGTVGVTGATIYSSGGISAAGDMSSGGTLGCAFIYSSGGGQVVGTLTADYLVSHGDAAIAGNCTVGYLTSNTGAVITGMVTMNSDVLRLNYPPNGVGTIQLGSGGATIGGDPTQIFLNAGDNSFTMDSTGLGIGHGMMWINNGPVVLQNGIGQQPGGGEWAAFCDERIKHNIVPYEAGLAEVLQLRPKVYSYIPETGTDPLARYVGLIGQEVQPIMPETVRQRRTVAPHLGTIAIDDLLEFNGTAVKYALVNAVQELAARVAALEGARA
jgi:Chaperone of endosialidase